MSQFPWVRFTGAAITLTGLGYTLMKATVPNEELYNRMSPDIRKKVDAARTLRETREAEMKQQVVAQTLSTDKDVNPDSIKPIWADSNGASSHLERKN
ncbi:hypothetical protein GYMLUDRAFT_44142 [Collybiopsis luxurians FD-317 M1]|uniref:Cytochrome b mRNA-processing protein 4 n=1 Tax=Collybiopsis luxurians FD-317 M1 TaxID=944289 RepID=A0A0D0CM83_9AGAR|nr:hypothetical protein GYMLUDRAFT_44142 [Collybiopsis luxurians FD-317 M1]